MKIFGYKFGPWGRRVPRAADDTAVRGPDGEPRGSIAELAITLEPRFMFDAAGLVTGLEVQADTVAEAQAEAALAAAESGWQPDTSLDPGSTDALLAALAQSQPASSVNEIVFVDTSVSNYEELLAGISPNIEVVLLHSNGDGVAQIAGVLEGRSDVSAIHIISHGDAGQLHLGGVTLSEDTMSSEFADELAVIGDALAESADILIYGCNFAGGEQGRVAMDTLTRLTGADVAASTDDSGYAGYGGDWNLEHHTGPIETGIAIAETSPGTVAWAADRH